MLKRFAVLRQAAGIRLLALPRPAQLLLMVAATLVLGISADLLAGSNVWSKLTNLEHQSPAAAQSWSALIYALLLVGGLPVAFLIWRWRDVNVREQIENARKDINLKEFQEVQLRAAGALDEKLPLEAREQLQIAALHQLRGFLRGDYGDSFKRPAFELLLAGHAAAVFRIGVPEVQTQVRGRTREEILGAVGALSTRLTPIDRARMLIIRDEAEHVFRAEYPLDGRRFDLLELREKRLADGKDYSESHFFGADLNWANLEGAYLIGAHLQGANLCSAQFKGAFLMVAQLEGAVLRDAHLEDANLTGTHLEGADLRSAQLEVAELRRAHLEGADFRGVRLEGADLRRAQLQGVDLRRAQLGGADLSWAQLDAATRCENATFDAKTQFGDRYKMAWSDLTVAEREKARAPWLARGMVRSDLPPPVEEEQSAAPAPD